MFRDISLGFESFHNNFEPVEQSSSYNPPLCKFLCDPGLLFSIPILQGKFPIAAGVRGIHVRSFHHMKMKITRLRLTAELNLFGSQIEIRAKIPSKAINWPVEKTILKIQITFVPRIDNMA